MAQSDLTAARPSGLHTMRAIAGGLLLLMAGLFVISHAFAEAHPAMPYLRAFSEAALVGGLADWFAVTALFRRPFGLPIPHTAIIPRSKERIAKALRDFVAENLLEPGNVGQRLAGQDLCGALATSMAQPRDAQRMAAEIANTLPGLLDAFDDEAIAEFARKQAAAFASDGRVAPALGQFLKLMTDRGRHQGVIDLAVHEAFRALEDNRAAIREGLRDRTAWLWRMIGLDTRLADSVINSLGRALSDMATDPHHPGRAKMTELLSRLAQDLQNSPELREKLDQAARDVLAEPIVATYLGGLWRDIKRSIEAQTRDKDGPFRAVLTDTILRVGQGLLEDAAAREAINVRLRAFIVELCARFGHDMSRLASETVRSWDSATVVEKLEQNVGKDLQFVRINGTVIGGLIGLTLYQASLIIG